MTTELDAALSDSPWAVSGVIFRLDHTLDDEGRPLSERRAPSSVKRDVTIELKPCPYRDERAGKPMNVSALAQITRHLSSVSADICGFRDSLNGSSEDEMGWTPLLLTVLDQLAAPAIYLLQKREPNGVIPAQIAVGHKLAAGYFGTLHRLLLAVERGEKYPISAEGFLAYVKQVRGLVGASEVCAGPTHMIAQLTELMMLGSAASKAPSRKGPDVSKLRLEIARALAAQFRIGVRWQLFDTQVERLFFQDWYDARKIKGANQLTRNKLAERANFFRDVDRSSFTAELLGAHPCGRDTVSSIASLIGYKNGAIELENASTSIPLADLIARCLRRYCQTVSELWQAEQPLRECLGYSRSAPFKLNALIFPPPQSIPWFEAILGHWLEQPSPGAMALRIHNQHRSTIISF